MKTLKTMKATYLTIIGSIVSSNALSAIPTKIGAININEDDIFATIWELVLLIIKYAAWLGMAAAIIVGVFVIIGALSESKEKGNMGILWKNITATLITIAFVMLLCILVIVYMDI